MQRKKLKTYELPSRIIVSFQKARKFYSFSAEFNEFLSGYVKCEEYVKKDKIINIDEIVMGC